MKVGWLIDQLRAIASERQNTHAMTESEWRNLDIVVRGEDYHDGNDFCGGIVTVEIETGCDETECLVIDASNEPGTT